eukprot:CAMPEP_0170492170 /NCGR_PEP_ID=MMETSP0208-20121228/11799_1 /TAXON_ID=197538 /ORGANISM="Strombidium inclinatum, Strain S3" /LENGTH=97 /DNA_ID=CAMNT_0010767871 /DNA_START=176 /DNA_END=469 /DNA_ORIENTATION=-
MKMKKHCVTMLKTLDELIVDWNSEKSRALIETIGTRHLRKLDTIRPHFELMKYGTVEMFKELIGREFGKNNSSDAWGQVFGLVTDEMCKFSEDSEDE